MDISGLNIRRIYNFIDNDVYKFFGGCPNYTHPKSIKQCTNWSRIVPDTEYITTLIVLQAAGL